MYPLRTVKHLIKEEQGYSKSFCVNETGLSVSLKLNIQDSTVQPLPCLPPLVQISNGYDIHDKGSYAFHFKSIWCTIFFS